MLEMLAMSRAARQGGHPKRYALPPQDLQGRDPPTTELVGVTVLAHDRCDTPTRRPRQACLFHRHV